VEGHSGKNNRRKAAGNHPDIHMICETVSMHPHHSAVQTSGVSPLDMTC